MTPNFGSTHEVPVRILRHFVLLALFPPSDSILHDIFELIFEEICGKFPERATRGLEERVVQATLDLYRRIENNFRPVPSKIHYYFNIRDVGALFKGMAISHTQSVRRKEILVRLWYHEALRTFADRLVGS